MQNFQVQVYEQRMDKPAPGQTAEQFAAKRYGLWPLREFGMVVPGDTVNEAKRQAKAELAPRLVGHQPPLRIVSFSVVESPQRIQVIVRRITQLTR